jgi:hypothetical protein
MKRSLFGDNQGSLTYNPNKVSAGYPKTMLDEDGMDLLLRSDRDGTTETPMHVNEQLS